jgi:hypothetical protein
MMVVSASSTPGAKSNDSDERSPRVYHSQPVPQRPGVTMDLLGLLPSRAIGE